MTATAPLTRDDEEAIMPWPPAWQTHRRALEARVERLTAELKRQENLLREVWMLAPHLRGLALLFYGVFCDTTLTENDQVKVDRSDAAFVIEDMLKSIASRIDLAEEHFNVSRNLALKETAQ